MASRKAANMNSVSRRHVHIPSSKQRSAFILRAAPHSMNAAYDAATLFVRSPTLNHFQNRHDEQQREQTNREAPTDRDAPIQQVDPRPRERVSLAPQDDAHGRPFLSRTSAVGAIRLISSIDSGFRQFIDMAGRPSAASNPIISSGINGSLVPTPRIIRSLHASMARPFGGLQPSPGPDDRFPQSIAERLNCQRGRPPA